MNAKRMLSTCGLALLALAAGRPATAQTLQIYFTPNSARAISLSTGTLYAGATYYNFGAILVGSAAVSNQPLIVSSTGTMATTLALQVSSTAADLGTYPAGPLAGQPTNQPWTISASSVPGNNTFVLFAAFQSTQPVNGALALPSDLVGFNPILASSSTAGGGNFQGANQNGVLVPAVPGENTVDLWFNLYVPQISSNLYPKQFNVTVTAN